MKRNRGLGFKIIVVCRCSKREINFGPYINNGFEINRQIILIMRLFGIGREGINIFCGLMDLGQGIRHRFAYENIVHHIYTATKTVFKALCIKARRTKKKLKI